MASSLFFSNIFEIKEFVLFHRRGEY